MSDAKKPASAKRIDVTLHDNAATLDEPPKPVIIKSRPILKAPESLAAPGPTPATGEAEIATSGRSQTVTKEPTLKPLEATTESDKDKVVDKPLAAAADKTVPAASESMSTPTAPKGAPAERNDKSSGEEATEDEPDQAAQATEQELNAEAEARAKHAEAVQKLVDAKQYFLPINTVEKRKTKHFVLLGAVLSVLLALTWADIALDAGLIQISGVKPITHFFSN